MNHTHPDRRMTTQVQDDADSLIPSRLRARRADVLPLAWTAAHAFAVGAVPQRKGPTGAALRWLDALWIAPRLLLYFPVIATGVSMGRLARVDRHALLLVMPDGSADNWRARGVLLRMLGLDMLVLLPVFTGLALVLPVWLAAAVIGGPLLAAEARKRRVLAAQNKRQLRLTPAAGAKVAGRAGSAPPSPGALSEHVNRYGTTTGARRRNGERVPQEEPLRIRRAAGLGKFMIACHRPASDRTFSQ